MKCLVFVAVFVVVLKNGAALQLQNIVATTEQGNVLGSERVNRKGEKFYSFTSIPYAKPPVGNLRFMPPQPPDVWNGTLNATEEPPVCYQRAAKEAGRFEILGKEDCLYLNVFTKKVPPTDEKSHLKPVMFYIHGGGNTEGSSRTELYGPEHLMTEDIVLVTINYRLNIFGFLSFEDESLGVTGNAALKDQVMALKWVNKNIKFFGGDPNLVTIFGESAGAADVEFQTMSLMSQGLFHRVICQSGSALNPWANGIKGNGKILAHQLGIQTDNEKEILVALKSRPVESLYLPYDVQIIGYRQNGIVVESPVKNAFLTENPRTLLQNGTFTKVPMMMGYNSDEGIFKLVLSGFNGTSYDVDFTEYVPNDLNPNNSSERRELIAKEIENFYNSRDYSNDQFQKEIDLFTDAHFLHGIYTSLRARLAASQSPIYFYRFSMSSKLNKIKNFNPNTVNRTGASHADDIFYLFKEKQSASIVSGSLEDSCVEKIVKLWTNFAKYGNPTPSERQDSIINVTWPEAEKDAIHYLEIGNTFLVGRDPDTDRMEFWDRLYKKYYER